MSPDKVHPAANRLSQEPEALAAASSIDVGDVRRVLAPRITGKNLPDPSQRAQIAASSPPRPPMAG